MTTLPPIGRPNKTGISFKLLGGTEYRRQYQRMFTLRKTSRRWWSGLSPKLMGQTKYVAAFRALRKQRLVRQSD
jgi:hypothetical protein